MAIEKKYNESGEMNPAYAEIIKTLCKENDREYFKNKLVEISEYFKERKKTGWPYIKTEHDLNVECHIAPLVKHCIMYLDGKLQNI